MKFVHNFDTLIESIDFDLVAGPIMQERVQ